MYPTGGVILTGWSPHVIFTMGGGQPNVKGTNRALTLQAPRYLNSSENKLLEEIKDNYVSIAYTAKHDCSCF